MNEASKGKEIVLRDFSNDFGELRRVLNSELSPNSYVDIRRKLNPKYLLVWADLLFSLALFGASTVIAGRYQGWLWIPMWALLIGLSVHRISLFLHEAAHFNLARSRVVNDLMTDLLVSPFVITSVGSYRPGHLLHHRLLGTSSDPERSYQFPLNWSFIFSGLFGLRVLDVVRSRDVQRTGEISARKVLVPMAGVAMYMSLVIWGLVNDLWSLSLSVAIGVCCVFPLVGSVRQLLEHRAGRGDYLIDDTFPVTRVFPTWPLGWLVGAAGFNLHLLHHWDPGISYTRLQELESLLSNSSAERIMRSRLSGYLQTFAETWS